MDCRGDRIRVALWQGDRMKVRCMRHLNYLGVLCSSSTVVYSANYCWSLTTASIFTTAALSLAISTRTVFLNDKFLVTTFLFLNDWLSAFQHRYIILRVQYIISMHMNPRATFSNPRPVICLRPRVLCSVSFSHILSWGVNTIYSLNKESTGER